MVFAGLLLVPPGVADLVQLTSRPPFRNVQVRDFSRDRVIFRGVSGQFLRKPLPEVETLVLDGHPAFNAAEQDRQAGHWEEALRNFVAARPHAADPWLSDLIHARLADTADRAGRFDVHVEAWAELIGSAPESARRLVPRRPGPPGSEMNVAARVAVAEALDRLTADAAAVSRPAARPPGAVDALRRLQLELAVYEDDPDLPPPPDRIAWDASASERSAVAPAGSPASAPAARPAEADVPIGILPPLEPDEPATGVLPAPETQPAAPTTVPSHAVPPPPPVTWLTADSLVLSGAERLLADGQAAAALRRVERGLPYVTRDDRTAWRIMLGRCRLEAGQADRAAADLMEIATTDRDAGRAAEALYYVGLAHERLDRNDVSARIYRDLLDKPDLPETLRRDAQAGLDRSRQRLGESPREGGE